MNLYGAIEKRHGNWHIIVIENHRDELSARVKLVLASR